MCGGQLRDWGIRRVRCIALLYLGRTCCLKKWDESMRVHWYVMRKYLPYLWWPGGDMRNTLARGGLVSFCGSAFSPRRGGWGGGDGIVSACLASGGSLGGFSPWPCGQGYQKCRPVGPFFWEGGFIFLRGLIGRMPGLVVERGPEGRG